MKRNLAMAVAVTASIGSMVVIGGGLGSSWHGSEEALNLLSYAIAAGMAGGLQALNESKKEKPNFEHIGVAALLSYLGLGYAVYEWLTKGTESEAKEFDGN
jgi:Na+/H+ antiporter NhaC